MIVALAIAGAVSSIAFRSRLLSPSGAVAATIVGAAAVLAGTRWIVLLLFFFITASALSRWRAAERDRLVGALIEKGSRRDAMQVLANGAVFAVSAFLSTRAFSSGWAAAGVGAIAAATADTWGTEIGTVAGGEPRSILSGRKVLPGTSGGITIAGTLAGFSGAIVTALLARLLDWPTPVHAVVLGGIAGSFVDSLLGATVQERRWCPSCSALTERRVHSCGTLTVQRGGIRGCDNDIVNLLSIMAGAAVTWTLS
jgi:uncharacterized protein (TIGR00297 family)